MRLALLHEASTRRGFLGGLFGGKKEPEKAKDKAQEEPGEEFDATKISVPQEPGSGLGKMVDAVINKPVSRRGFFGQAGSAAAYLSGSPVLNLAKSAAQVHGALDHLTDDVLGQTPEDKWMDQVSPGRMQKFMAANPDHGKHEAVAKIVTMMTYGLLRTFGVHKGPAEQLSDKVGGASKGLSLIASNYQLKQSDIMDTAVSQGCYFDDRESAIKFANFVRHAAPNYGITLDLGNKKHPIETQKTWDEFKRARATKQAARIAARNKEYAAQQAAQRSQDDRDEAEAISRWESEGGATFEARLRAALAMI